MTDEEIEKESEKSYFRILAHIKSSSVENLQTVLREFEIRKMDDEGIGIIIKKEIALKKLEKL